MAIFGFGQQDPYAEAEQAAQDRQTAFQGIKDNLPALGLIAGLSMLARNNGTRSVGQLIGQAGGDALNAYGTWRKMEDVKARQKQLDDIAKEEREYARSQDAFRNDMAERKFAMDAANMAFQQNMARQRLGMAAAQHALARQSAAQEAALGKMVTFNGVPGYVREGVFYPVKDAQGNPLQPKENEPKLSDAAKKQAISIGNLDSKLNEIEKLINDHPDSTGFWYGTRVGKALSPYTDEEGVETRSTLMNLASALKKESAGANLSLSEKEWLSFIPTEGDNAKTIRSKINAFRNVLRGEADTWQKFYGPNTAFSDMRFYKRPDIGSFDK